VGNLVREIVIDTKNIQDVKTFDLIDIRMDLDAKRCACQVVGPQPSETRQEFGKYIYSIEHLNSMITYHL
jgi:hypothetical protein